MLSNERFIESLKQLCSIESVAGVDIGENAPYGKGSAEALDFMLSLCESFGFRTKCCADHRCGWAEIGEGEEIVGILGHLDVVPAGTGWDYPAYGLTEDGDRIYGRGVVDDKGPTMACVYAMKDLLDSGVKLDRRVRIVFGQSEETGVWDDMEYYKANEEPITFGFTPDADFPAIYGEKRILCFDLKLSDADGLVINGGSASNMVADRCSASVTRDGTVTEWETSGRAAHASTPEDGVNAISALMEKLGEVIPAHPFVSFYRKYIGLAFNGENMGCALADEQSGALTMNVGMVRTDDSGITLTVDVREPVTFSDRAVLDPVEAAAAEYGLRVVVTENTPAVYMDKNGPVITKLLEVYRAETGDLSEPTVIGGGTYARAMDNIVAFGPMQPGRELTEHQKNEYILKEDLLLVRKIYRNAICALARN